MSDDESYYRATSRYWGVFGKEGQDAIRSATVAVGGVGGVGSAVALLLAKASVGRLVFCDRDRYGVENVCQQALASHDVVGMNKAEAAAQTCARHTQFTKIVGRVGDLTDRETVESLVEGVDIFISAVDNPEARHIMGVLCDRKGIPFVVPVAIGWSVLHTVYFPGENSYAAQLRQMTGGRVKDVSLDMKNPVVREFVEREWKQWSVAVAGWTREALLLFLGNENSCYWTSAPQCFFSASVGVADTLKILAGMGAAFIYPSFFCYDLKLHRVIAPQELFRRRRNLQEVWDKGPEAVCEVVESWG